MKDPGDVRIRAYEILDVDPDVSCDDAAKAFSNFLRDPKKMARRNAALLARDRICRPNLRIADEVLYYPSVAYNEPSDLNSAEAPSQEKPGLPAKGHLFETSLDNVLKFLPLEFPV